MRYDQIIDVRLLAPMATTVAIIVTIILWLLNQRRKELSYRVLWQDALTRARSVVRQRLDIRFDGKTIDDAGLVIVQIVNSGHLPISPADYQSRLTISAGPGSKVLFADISSTTPGDLEDRCRTASGERKSLIETLENNEVRLSPILLNDGDSMTIQMLVEDWRGGVKVGGHISGIRRIAMWKPTTLLSTSLTNVGALSMAGAALLVEPSAIVKYGLSEALPGLLIFLFGYTLLSAGIYNKQKATAASNTVELVS